MITLSYTVAGQLIEPASVPQYLVADTVGVYQVAFTFDADWADMGEKTVVFRNPQVIDPDYRDVPVEFPLDANGQALVPAALLDPGKLFIGVYGTNSTQQLPTIWAPPLQVVPGASPGVEPSDDPALGSVIRTIPQTLTEEEKAQARENIGANEIQGGTPGNVVIIGSNLNIADSGVSKDNLILAPQLTSHIYAEDKTPYLYRQTGGGVEAGTREYDSIVGGCIVHNQMYQRPNPITLNGVTVTAVDSVTVTLSGTATGNTYLQAPGYRTVANHVYLARHYLSTPGLSLYIYNDGGGITSTEAGAIGKANASKVAYVRISSGVAFGNGVTLKGQLIDLTERLGTAVADRLYAMEQASAGSGIAVLNAMGLNQHSPYTAEPSLLSAMPTAHKMVGFNRFDGNFEVGGIAWATGAEIVAPTSRRTDYIPVFANMPYYLASYYGVGICWYDSAKTYIRVTLPGKDVISTSPTNAAYARLVWTSVSDDSLIRNSCFNISDPTRNGSYEPYEEHTYPLAGIELRGVPAVDSAGNIYFDGDTYAPDGTVVRRYAVKTIDGTEAGWYKSSTNNGSFYLAMGAQNYKSRGNVICAKLITVHSLSYYAVGCLYPDYNDISFWFADGVDKTLEQFKAWLSSNPFTIIYEVTTPTVETATPYDSLQICDPLGTEEYVDDRSVPVPVGHVTKYPVDQVRKLDGLPSDFTTLLAYKENEFKATRTYTKYDFITINNVLYEVTATTIASGTALTVGSNITQATVGNVLKQILSSI